MGRGFLVALALLITGCAKEEDQPSFPYFSEEGGRIRDMAEVLSPNVESALTTRLDAAEAQLGPQLVVVTVPSLHGYDIGSFSLEYARAWGVGDAQRNDGLQILVAPNERKVRIEVGKGIESTFTDRYCKDVIDVMTPYFRESDYDGGVTAGAEILVEHMRQHPTLPANDNAAAPTEKAA